MKDQNREERTNPAWRRVMWLVVVAGFGGAGSGLMTSSALSAQSGCAKKVCDVDYNYCASSDVDYNCSGDPCKSSECKVLPEL